MKKILLATVTVLGFVGAASAADLRPLPARPVVAPVNWTSCYIGGYVGGARGLEFIRVTDANGYNFPFSGVYDSWNYDAKSSFLGGGTLGCNWQPIGSPFVVGLEGELGYLRVTGSALDPFDTLFGITSNTRIGDWYGMVTGRLGYAGDRVMVYVKGGAAFVDVKTNVIDPTVFPTFFAQDSQSMATWTAGGGIEWAFDWNWSVKAEYMFIFLDDRAACGYDFAGNGLNGAGTYCFNHALDGIHTAKIGLNYRFGGGAPVVARY